MKQSITVSQDAFHAMNREGNVSYPGRHGLYGWIEQWDEDCGTKTELDVIDLCREFSEYDSFEEIQENYTDIESLEDLHNHTTVIPFGAGQFIIQDF